MLWPTQSSSSSAHRLFFFFYYYYFCFFVFFCGLSLYTREEHGRRAGAGGPFFCSPNNGGSRATTAGLHLLNFIHILILLLFFLVGRGGAPNNTQIFIIRSGYNFIVCITYIYAACGERIKRWWENGNFLVVEMEICICLNIHNIRTIIFFNLIYFFFCILY